MTEIKLTELGTKIFLALGSQLQADEPSYSGTDLKDVARVAKVEVKSAKGALGQLNKLGLVYTSGEVINDSGSISPLHLSDKGWELYKSLTKSVEEVKPTHEVPAKSKAAGKGNKNMAKGGKKGAGKQNVDTEAVLNAVNYLSEKNESNPSLEQVFQHMGLSSTVALSEAVDKASEEGNLKMEGSILSLTEQGKTLVDSLTPADDAQAVSSKKTKAPRAAKEPKAPKEPKEPKSKELTDEEKAELAAYQQRYADRGYDLSTHTKNGQKSKISPEGRARMALAAKKRWERERETIIEAMRAKGEPKRQEREAQKAAAKEAREKARAEAKAKKDAEKAVAKARKEEERRVAAEAKAAAEAEAKAAAEAAQTEVAPEASTPVDETVSE